MKECEATLKLSFNRNSIEKIIEYELRCGKKLSFHFSVVSGSRDATLRMWDINTGECLHVLMGHVAAVRCVQYDGRLVVSGAYDYMIIHSF